jgi:hypothetical protein
MSKLKTILKECWEPIFVGSFSILTYNVFKLIPISTPCECPEEASYDVFFRMLAVLLLIKAVFLRNPTTGNKRHSYNLYILWCVSNIIDEFCGRNKQINISELFLLVSSILYTYFFILKVEK